MALRGEADFFQNTLNGTWTPLLFPLMTKIHKITRLNRAEAEG